MPTERFFIPVNFKKDLEVVLEGPEFHHLAHVMRCKEGDKAELVNGQGALAQAKLARRDKKQALFLIENILEKERGHREIILAQAIPRINRLDFIIEKGTELNATHFWLFPGDLSERKTLTDHQLERLHGLSIAAMKQCGRLFLPSIQIKPRLTDWTNLDCSSYFGDLRENAQAFRQVYEPCQSALFFIGPESGFSEKEIEKMVNLGAQGVQLHDNILRTDTAALTALCLMGA